MVAACRLTIQGTALLRFHNNCYTNTPTCCIIYVYIALHLHNALSVSENIERRIIGSSKNSAQDKTCKMSCSDLRYSKTCLNTQERHETTHLRRPVCGQTFRNRRSPDYEVGSRMRRSAGSEKRGNRTNNIRINVTLRRDRNTIAVVQKQYVLHVLSVCL